MIPWFQESSSPPVLGKLNVSQHFFFASSLNKACSSATFLCFARLLLDVYNQSFCLAVCQNNTCWPTTSDSTIKSSIRPIMFFFFLAFSNSTFVWLIICCQSTDSVEWWMLKIYFETQINAVVNSQMFSVSSKKFHCDHLHCYIDLYINYNFWKRKWII